MGAKHTVRENRDFMTYYKAKNLILGHALKTKKSNVKNATLRSLTKRTKSPSVQPPISYQRCKNCKPLSSITFALLTELLHPQAKFTTSCTRGNPILALMELRNTRYSSDTLTSQLSELLSIRCIHVYESVHVSDDEALDVVGGLELPLRAETVLHVSI